MRVRLCAVFALVALSATGGWAHVQPGQGTQPGWPACRADSSTKADLSIDATRGTGTGRLCFPKTAVAKIEVYNKNPFSFGYTIKKDAKVIEQTDLGTFLKDLAGADFIKLDLSKPAAAKEEKTSTTSGATGSPFAEIHRDLVFSLPSRRQCPELNDLSRRHTELGTKLETIRRELDQAQKDQQGTAQTYQAIQPVLTSPLSECSKLQDSAAMFKEVKPSTLALQATGQDLLDIGKDLTKLNSDIEAAKKRSSGCASDYDDLLIEVQKDQLDVTSLQKAADTLIERNKPFDALTAQIAKVKADPHAFFEIANVGPVDQDTDVTVTVERNGPTEKDKSAQVGDSFKLEFRGDPRFVLAAGAAATRLRTREFSIAKGFALKPDGTRVDPMATAPDNIVAVNENSESRVTPMLVLHGRAWNFRSPRCAQGDLGSKADATGEPGCRQSVRGIWISAGVTANSTSKGTDLDLLAGLSTDLIENRLFLTIGRYWGKVDDLQDGFYPGGKVPDGVTSLPIRRARKWSWAVALSYRIQ